MSAPTLAKQILADGNHSKEFNLPIPQAILFDWDDTIIDTWPHLWTLYQEVFHKHNAPLPSEHYCREMAVRDAPKLFCDAMGDTIGMKARHEVVDLYQKRYLHSPKPYQGAKECLDYLKSLSIPLAIVSNKLTQFIHVELKVLGWDHFFGAVTGRDIVGKKPNPVTITHTLKEIHKTPSKNIWFMGDSIVDHETATNAGCFSVGFGPIHHMPELSVTNWNQFGQILEKLPLKIS